MTVTASLVRELFHYDRDTGVFTWAKASDPRRSRDVGAIAGSLDWKGYRRIAIRRRRYRAHHVAWLYVYGEWPPGQIDHINRAKDDNRIANLRIATPAQNKWNSGPPRTNTSGFRGVSVRPCGKFMASIRLNGRQEHLGLFWTPEAASAAYSKAEAKYRGAFCGLARRST